jgi:hypothetical protein
VGKRSRRKGGGAEDGAPRGAARADEAAAADGSAAAADAAVTETAAPRRPAAAPRDGEPASAPPADAAAESGAAADGAEAADPADGRAPSDRPPPGPRFADGRLREAIAFVDEVDMHYHLFRWVALRGELPTARDWLPREDLPHPDAVIDVFGSWPKFLETSGLVDSPLLVRLRAMDDRERDLDARQRELEREQARAADLRRQLDTARRKRDEAERERDEEARRATRAERVLGDATKRAETAEAALHERREVAEERVEAAPEAAHDAILAELEAVREHREQLLRETEELREAAERDRRAIAELSAALGDRPVDDPAAAEVAADPEDAPKSVLEAVRLAAGGARHLTFTESAFDSASDSPYRRPGEVLEVLRKLDALGERYDAGQMGMSLGQAAQELGLTWRAGVSELARTRFARHYVVSHDGHTLELGPHIALGSGSGAGLIARIYLHVADGNGDVPRGIYVGHVGRHLPDTTT